MKRTTLIAISVGSILGTALSSTYAQTQTSGANQQAPQASAPAVGTAGPSSPQTTAPAVGQPGPDARQTSAPAVGPAGPNPDANQRQIQEYRQQHDGAKEQDAIKQQRADERSVAQNRVSRVNLDEGRASIKVRRDHAA